MCTGFRVVGRLKVVRSTVLGTATSHLLLSSPSQPASSLAHPALRATLAPPLMSPERNIRFPPGRGAGLPCGPHGSMTQVTVVLGLTLDVTVLSVWISWWAPGLQSESTPWRAGFAFCACLSLGAGCCRGERGGVTS